MTTLRRPLPSAVRLTVPLAPLPFCSTSFAFTVVSAAALIGRHNRAAAAASISELRNLVIYSLPQIGSTSCSVTMSCPPFDPRYRQPMSLDTEASLESVSTDKFVYHAGLAPRLTLRNRVYATQPDKIYRQRRGLWQAGGGAGSRSDWATRLAFDH